MVKQVIWRESPAITSYLVGLNPDELFDLYSSKQIIMFNLYQTGVRPRLYEPFELDPRAGRLLGKTKIETSTIEQATEPFELVRCSELDFDFNPINNNTFELWKQMS